MGKRSETLLPLLAMVTVQLGYSGMNISSKVAMNSGMQPLILVAYRQVFATFAIIPFAFFLERKTRPTITKKVLFHIFLCSLFGSTGNQMFYFMGLKYTTPTISCAMNNTLPAMTFILAAPFGMEAVGFKTRRGQAKIIGTIICIGGAMVLSFYHGNVIGIPQPNFHLKVPTHPIDKTKVDPINHPNFYLGSFLLFLSNLAMAIWFILQAKLRENFAAPYTSSALMCFFAGIQCILIALCMDHKLVDWSLNSKLRILTTIYAGVVGSGLALCLMSWTIQRKGPVYASVFTPLLLVIVALLSWALLQERLYVGTLVGAILIVLGLYAVLWGKNKEIDDNKQIQLQIQNQRGSDLEIQQQQQQQQQRNNHVDNLEMSEFD